VIIEVWLSGSEPTLIKRYGLVQQLSVRKNPDNVPKDSSILSLYRGRHNSLYNDSGKYSTSKQVPNFQIHLHGNNLGKLHEFVSSDILPPELGGEGPALDPLVWTQKLIDSAIADATASTLSQIESSLDDEVHGREPVLYNFQDSSDIDLHAPMYPRV